MIDLDIIEEGGAWGALDPLEALAKQAIAAAFSVAQTDVPETAEISLLLTDDEQMARLNGQWRGKDKTTNVLSFPAPAQIGDGPRHLGDIVLAFETVSTEAQAEGKTMEQHVAHLVVHATLHLLGYDHETEADAQVMEGLEVTALASLDIPNPYRDMAA